MMNKHFADHTYDDDYYMIGRPETITNAYDLI